MKEMSTNWFSKSLSDWSWIFPPISFARDIASLGRVYGHFIYVYGCVMVIFFLHESAKQKFFMLKMNREKNCSLVYAIDTDLPEFPITGRVIPWNGCECVISPVSHWDNVLQFCQKKATTKINTLNRSGNWKSKTQYPPLLFNGVQHAFDLNKWGPLAKTSTCVLGRDLNKGSKVATASWETRCELASNKLNKKLLCKKNLRNPFHLSQNRTKRFLQTIKCFRHKWYQIVRKI